MTTRDSQDTLQPDEIPAEVDRTVAEHAQLLDTAQRDVAENRRVHARRAA